MPVVATIPRACGRRSQGIGVDLRRRSRQEEEHLHEHECIELEAAMQEAATKRANYEAAVAMTPGEAPIPTALRQSGLCELKVSLEEEVGQISEAIRHWLQNGPHQWGEQDSRMLKDLVAIRGTNLKAFIEKFTGEVAPVKNDEELLGKYKRCKRALKQCDTEIQDLQQDLIVSKKDSGRVQRELDRAQQEKDIAVAELEEQVREFQLEASMRACAGAGPEEESKAAAEQLFFEMRDMQRDLKEEQSKGEEMKRSLEGKDGEIVSLKRQMEGLIREVKISMAKQKRKAEGQAARVLPPSACGSNGNESRALPPKAPLAARSMNRAR
jgi:predicted RNase H-like nuclease (RuvC/YqgF family)